MLLVMNDQNRFEKEFGLPPLFEGHSLSSQVAQAILTRIVNGDIPLGERLPAERTLVEEYGVSRAAVREALTALELLGVVETLAGSGTYVRSVTSELLPKTLNWGLLLARDSYKELLEVRSSLEIFQVRLIVDRLASGELQVSDLHELIHDVEEQDIAIAAGDVDGFIRADLSFHQRLARLSGNGIVEQLIGTLRALLRVWIENQIRTTGEMEQAALEHRSVAQALLSPHPTQAIDLMEWHMVTASERIMSAATLR